MFCFYFTLFVERILDVSASLFEDVADDFSLLKSIARHFEKWKRTQTDTYQEAYIGLCLPKLFSPYVRAHLVLWNPLEVGAFTLLHNPALYECTRPTLVKVTDGG